MTSNEQPVTTIPPTNKHSIISLILGILTLLALCGGIAPIPFSGFICYPASGLFGIVALVYGLVSLRQIKRNNETGHPMAWTGILIGAFVILCMICMAITIASLFYFAPTTFPVQQFIQKFQL